MIGIDLRFLGSTLVGYGRHAPEDLRNAGMDAQQRNADAYRQAMANAQPASLVLPWDVYAQRQRELSGPEWSSPRYAAFRAVQDLRASMRRPDWIYLGWLTAMAGVALIRAGWLLLAR
jgi:hypothetical protein